MFAMSHALVFAGIGALSQASRAEGKRAQPEANGECRTRHAAVLLGLGVHIHIHSRFGHSHTIQDPAQTALHLLLFLFLFVFKTIQALALYVYVVLANNCNKQVERDSRLTTSTNARQMHTIKVTQQRSFMTQPMVASSSPSSRSSSSSPVSMSVRVGAVMWGEGTGPCAAKSDVGW